MPIAAPSNTANLADGWARLAAQLPNDFDAGLFDGRFAGRDVPGDAGLTGQRATMPLPNPSELFDRSGIGAAPNAD